MFHKHSRRASAVVPGTADYWLTKYWVESVRVFYIAVIGQVAHGDGIQTDCS